MLWEFSNTLPIALKKDAAKESKLNNTQCGFRHGRSTTDHISLSNKILKSWEYAKDIFTCFVDLKRAYNRVPCQKLLGMGCVYGA